MVLFFRSPSFESGSKVMIGVSGVSEGEKLETNLRCPKLEPFDP